MLKVALASYGEGLVISVEKELPHGLSRAAIVAVRNIKLKPALFKDRAVTQFATVEYLFAP